MKTKNKVGTNLIYNMIYQIFIMIVPLITAPYVSRIVGAEGVGIYSFYYSIALYFSYFAMIGIANYGNRNIAKKRENIQERNETFSSIYYIQMITSIIVIIIYFMCCAFLFKQNTRIAVISSLFVIASLFDVSWLYFGLEEFKITSIRQMLVRCISLIAIFILVKNKDDIYVYTLIMALGNFLSSFILWLMAWKKVRLKKIPVKEIMKHIKPCLILFIPIIATSVYRQMDKIMVGFWCGMKEVGYYENSEKLITISLGLISSFSAVIMPKISNLVSKNNVKKARDLFDKSMEFAMWIGIAICFGIISVSSEFILIFFGEEFEPSIMYSIILAFSVPFISWANIVRVLYLIPCEKDKVYVTSIIIGAILNATCNVILIPRISTMGAIVGTLIAESIVAIYQTIKIRKNIAIIEYFKKTFAFCLIALIMLIVILVLKNNLQFNNLFIKLICEVVIGSIIYIGGSVLFFWKSNDFFFQKAIEFVNKLKINKIKLFMR